MNSTEKNPWEIDFIDKMFVFSEINNFSQFNTEIINSNFQLASFSIDTGIKIYSERVDTLYNFVFGFLNGLENGKKKIKKIQQNEKVYIREEGDKLKTFFVTWKNFVFNEPHFLAFSGRKLFSSKSIFSEKNWLTEFILPEFFKKTITKKIKKKSFIPFHSSLEMCSLVFSISTFYKKFQIFYRISAPRNKLFYQVFKILQSGKKITNFFLELENEKNYSACEITGFFPSPFYQNDVKKILELGKKKKFGRIENFLFEKLEEKKVSRQKKNKQLLIFEENRFLKLNKKKRTNGKTIKKKCHPKMFSIDYWEIRKKTKNDINFYYAFDDEVNNQNGFNKNKTIKDLQSYENIRITSFSKGRSNLEITEEPRSRKIVSNESLPFSPLLPLHTTHYEITTIVGERNGTCLYEIQHNFNQKKVLSNENVSKNFLNLAKFLLIFLQVASERDFFIIGNIELKKIFFLTHI